MNSDFEFGIYMHISLSERCMEKSHCLIALCCWAKFCGITKLSSRGHVHGSWTQTWCELIFRQMQMTNGTFHNIVIILYVHHVPKNVQLFIFFINVDQFFIIFGKQYTLVSCNTAVIHLPTSLTYCCYTTYGNLNRIIVTLLTIVKYCGCTDWKISSSSAQLLSNRAHILQWLTLSSTQAQMEVVNLDQ